MKKYLNLRGNICLGLIFAFLANSIGPVPLAQAEDFRLPAPGVMVHLSPEFNPPILKGIKVHPDNPFRFDFILDQGDSNTKTESIKLIKYFLASLTIPDKDLWVNLSPYEKNRVIPHSFGLTQMGRDLLAEDYMLKQITASLIYPEDAVGKKFWKRIYEEAMIKFGTTNIPVNTFNKVWIVPAKAVVYENAQAGTAYIVESQLKVMLEEDYLALSHSVVQHNDTSPIGSNIIREIVIPELTKEVNDGKNFFQLRQVYNSLILAAWYKKKIKDSILEQVYEDKKKVAGVGYKNSPDLNIEAIYQRYLQAFKKGVYNYIKEEQSPLTDQIIPRKYFSGGTAFDDAAMAHALQFTADPQVLAGSGIDHAQVVEVKLDQAMTSQKEAIKAAEKWGLEHAKKYVEEDPQDLALQFNIPIDIAEEIFYTNKLDISRGLMNLKYDLFERNINIQDMLKVRPLGQIALEYGVGRATFERVITQYLTAKGQQQLLEAAYARKDQGETKVEISDYVGRDALKDGNLNLGFLLPNGKTVRKVFGKKLPIGLGKNLEQLFAYVIIGKDGKVKALRFEGIRGKETPTSAWNWDGNKLIRVINEQERRRQEERRKQAELLKVAYARKEPGETKVEISEYVGKGALKLGILNLGFLLPNGKTVGKTLGKSISIGLGVNLKQLFAYVIIGKDGKVEAIRFEGIQEKETPISIWNWDGSNLIEVKDEEEIRRELKSKEQKELLIAAYARKEPGEIKVEISDYVGKNALSIGELSLSFLLPNGKTLHKTLGKDFRAHVPLALGPKLDKLFAYVIIGKDGKVAAIRFEGIRGKKISTSTWNWDGNNLIQVVDEEEKRREEQREERRKEQNELLKAAYGQKKQGEIKVEISDLVGESALKNGEVNAGFLLPSGKTLGKKFSLGLDADLDKLFAYVIIGKDEKVEAIRFEGIRGKEIFTSTWNWDGNNLIKVLDEEERRREEDRKKQSELLKAAYARKEPGEIKVKVTELVGKSALKDGVLNNGFLLPNGKILGKRRNIGLGKKLEDLFVYVIIGKDGKVEALRFEGIRRGNPLTSTLNWDGTVLKYDRAMSANENEDFQIRSRRVDEWREASEQGTRRIIGRTIKVAGEVMDKFIVVTGAAQDLISFLRTVAVQTEGRDSGWENLYKTVELGDEYRSDRGRRIEESGFDIAWFNRFYVWGDDDGKPFLVFTNNGDTPEIERTTAVFEKAVGVKDTAMTVSPTDPRILKILAEGEDVNRKSLSLYFLAEEEEPLASQIISILEQMIYSNFDFRVVGRIVMIAQKHPNHALEAVKVLARAAAQGYNAAKMDLEGRIYPPNPPLPNPIWEGHYLFKSKEAAAGLIHEVQEAARRGDEDAIYALNVFTDNHEELIPETALIFEQAAIQGSKEAAFYFDDKSSLFSSFSIRARKIEEANVIIKRIRNRVLDPSHPISSVIEDRARKWFKELAYNVFQWAGQASDGKTLSDVLEGRFHVKSLDILRPLLWPEALREHIISNRWNNKVNRHKVEGRPLAVVLYSKSDHNAILMDPRPLEKMMQYYDIMYYEVGSPTEVVKAIKDATKYGRKASLIFFSGHGTPDSIILKTKEDREFLLSKEHQDMLIKAGLAKRFMPGAKGILHSCSTGCTDHGENIADIMARALGIDFWASEEDHEDIEINYGQDGQAVGAEFSSNVSGNTRKIATYHASPDRAMSSEMVEIHDRHDQGYYQIKRAIADKKIRAGLPLLLFDQHNDNGLLDKVDIGNWITHAQDEKLIGDTFWIYPKGREIPIREDKNTFKSKGYDLRKMLRDNIGSLRNGVLLTFDMDYFASNGVLNQLRYMPPAGEIEKRMANIFALLKEFDIPVYLVNGAYSTPIFSSVRYRQEFGDALLKEANNYDLSMSVESKGGIDLTPAHMNLQTQNSGGDIKFHLDSAMLIQLQNAPGFVPVIINIHPMTDLRMFLGLPPQRARLL